MSGLWECYEPEEDAHCEPCEGTGFAPNCGPRDRERGDLWACSYCNGSGYTDFADGDEQAEGDDFTEELP